MGTNFTLGIQVTIIGMALVFLTLIIVMLAIILLDRVFRPKAKVEEESSVVEQPRVVTQDILEPAPRAVEATDGSDEAAAIGLALAAALASLGATATRGASRQALAQAIVFPWDKPRATDVEPTGEVVTVVNIDSGSAVWRSQGRLKAAERR